MLTAFLLALPCPPPQDARDVPVELAGRIERAIDRGVQALLVQQELDGSWRAHQGGYGSGQTALSLYTLLKCGLPVSHPAVARAQTCLRAHPPEKTYTAACQLLALTALGDPDDADRIGVITEELADWQRGGGFSYPDGVIDLSNGQYAALGLRAAARAGYAVDERVWERLADDVMAHQEDLPDDRPAGFAYTRTDYATGSMTTAGVVLLAICREMGARDRELDRSLQRGLDWLAREFSVTENPRREPPYQYFYYYLYGLERVGALLELERIGEHRWYQEGAEFLVEGQHANGRFGTWGNQDETAFALLFLSRATATTSGARKKRGEAGRGGYVTDPDGDVVLRASGDTPLTLWIESIGADARAKHAWDDGSGTVLHIEEVEYVVTSGPGIREESVCSSVPFDPALSSKDERFAVQHSFERPGTYRIHARVRVLGKEGPTVLSSPPLDVIASQASNPELLRYASDHERNLLADVRVDCEASSFVQNFEPNRVADGWTGSGWRCADTDAEPWIRLEPKKAVKCRMLVVTHLADLAAASQSHVGRPLTIAVTLNGGRRPIEVELEQDDWKKCVIDLGKTQKVSSLEIRITGRSGGIDGRDGVGFGEIELVER